MDVRLCLAINSITNIAVDCRSPRRPRSDVCTMLTASSSIMYANSPGNQTSATTRGQMKRNALNTLQGKISSKTSQQSLQPEKNPSVPSCAVACMEIWEREFTVSPRIAYPLVATGAKRLC